MEKDNSCGHSVYGREGGLYMWSRMLTGRVIPRLQLSLFSWCLTSLTPTPQLTDLLIHREEVEKSVLDHIQRCLYISCLVSHLATCLVSHPVSCLVSHLASCL